MPKAKKLPSGSYRCQVYAGYDLVDGKKKLKYESFTAPTKREAEAMAARWAACKKERPADLTVIQAIDKYIESRRNVLSPSTIRGYIACKKRFEDIQGKRIRSLTNTDVQMWVSKLSADLSSKSVMNTYGLLVSALKFAYPDIQITAKLPAKTKPDYYLPPDNDIQTLLSCISGELWIAVMLARFYGLRRSEICALKSDDLNGNVLTIRRSIVHDDKNGWIIKDIPKTYDSYRTLLIADPLLSEMKQISGQIIKCNPDALANRFRRGIRNAGIKPFNFHILRHLYASSAAMLGIPDFYTARMGGWSSNSKILKSVYQNVRNNDLIDQMNRMNNAMQSEISHEISHDQKKGMKKAAE